MTPAREKVLAAARAEPLLGKGALAQAAGCTTGVVNALLAAGALELAPIPAEAPVAALDADHAPPHLSEPQARAAALLVESVAARRFGVALLEGVTGSGKTEVYMEAVAAALREGRQALVLLPEIALTTQFLARFAARFGALPAEWHSAIPSRRRALVWHAVATGEAKVVVGARSALFLPFENLAVIVVDEEHEAAYKQEDGVTYHARDMAVVRGRIEEAAVVLASATPSLETAGERAPGPLRAPSAPRPLRGTAAARDRRAGPCAAIRRRAAASSRHRWSRPSATRSSAASRRCSSSIAAATRRLPCAGPAAIVSSARIARPGWSSTASATL